MSNGFADVDNAQLTPPLKKYCVYSRLGDSRRRECTVADDDAPFERCALASVVQPDHGMSFVILAYPL